MSASWQDKEVHRISKMNRIHSLRNVNETKKKQEQQQKKPNNNKVASKLLKYVLLYGTQWKILGLCESFDTFLWSWIWSEIILLFCALFDLQLICFVPGLGDRISVVQREVLWFVYNTNVPFLCVLMCSPFVSCETLHLKWNHRVPPVT